MDLQTDPMNEKHVLSLSFVIIFTLVLLAICVQPAQNVQVRHNLIFRHTVITTWNTSTSSTVTTTIMPPNSSATHQTSISTMSTTVSPISVYPTNSLAPVSSVNTYENKGGKVWGPVIATLLSVFIVIWFLINIYNLYPLVLSYTKRSKTKGNAVAFKDYRNKPDSEFPVIALLIPAYNEKEVLEDCVKGVYNAEYPKDKLEIIVLTEKGDYDTIAVAKIAQEKYGIKHLEIGATHEPQGKPRALNQALRHIKSDMVGVLDAEDIIEPLMFKKAAYKIEVGGYDAVQGILDMVNEHDGLKNIHFRGEYGYWFRIYLPALESAGYPIPLGGTSCFIKTSVLRAVGGWDSYNLTEDFELGLRLYNNNRKVGLDDSTETSRMMRSIYHHKYLDHYIGSLETVTREESPLHIRAWIRQRTRWQRGKIQTMKKIYANPPKSLARKLHSLFMSFLPHITVISVSGIVMSVYIYMTQTPLISPILILAELDIAAIAVYSVLQGYGYLKAVRGERSNFRELKALFVILTTPLYWILIFIADLRAIKQEYFDRRIFWEKTTHFGRSRSAGVNS